MLRGYLELWKQTVTVQQHFNEIEWKVRGVALTTVAAILGAASITGAKQSTISLFSFQINSAAGMVLVAAAIWIAFYFVDAEWYHRLLKASVSHGVKIEAALTRYLPDAGLTATISAGSPSKWWRLPALHSSGKLRLFYGAITGVLVLLAVAVQFGGK